jgi:hypothetical protein
MMLTATLVGLAIAAAPPATKAPSNIDAQGIVRKAMARNLFGLSGTAVATMTVHASTGDEKVRDLALKLLRTPEGLQRILVSFRSPPEVAGTSFLVIERPEGVPDQYLYLPALKRVRRLAAGQATDSFMGSDLAYIDLSPLPQDTGNEVEYKRLDDQDVGGQPSYVVEAIIKTPGSPYSKITVSIHRTHLVPLKMEFVDALGKPLKVALIKKLKKIDGKLIPIELEMRNVQKNTWTLITLNEINLKAKLSDADFSPEAMVN